MQLMDIHLRTITTETGLADKSHASSSISVHLAIVAINSSGVFDELTKVFWFVEERIETHRVDLAYYIRRDLLECTFTCFTAHCGTFSLGRTSIAV